jgi:hypothetical protein
MGFMLEKAGKNIRLIITKKEGFIISDSSDAIILEGPEESFAFLGQMLGEEFQEAA